MGLKSIIDHYGIKHIVHLSKSEQDGRACTELHIGSAYIPNLLVFRVEGGPVAFLEDKSSGVGSSKELLAVKSAICQNLGLFKSLFNLPNAFTQNLPVYIYKNGAVVEEFCETRGWPNVTHEGVLMHENVYFDTPEKAAKHGYSDVVSEFRFGFEMQRRACQDLLEAQAVLQKATLSQRTLLQQHPELTDPLIQSAYDYVAARDGWTKLNELLNTPHLAPEPITPAHLARMTGRWRGLMLIYAGDLLIPTRTLRSHHVFKAAQEIFGVCYGDSPLPVRCQIAQLPITLPDGQTMPIFDLFLLDELSPEIIEIACDAVRNALRGDKASA